MSKAIVTKYIGPTNHRSARIRVTSEGMPRMYVAWDDALYIDANHTAAAKAFALKHEWWGQWCGGGLPDQTGNCYVRVPFLIESKAPRAARHTEQDFYTDPTTVTK